MDIGIVGTRIHRKSSLPRAEPGRFGNVSAASSALPVSTLVPGYTLAGQPPGAIAVAHTGVAAPLGHLEQAKPPREYRRATLWGVLILGVVVLAWMAWQLSRQLNASSSLKSEADASDRPA